MTITNAEARAQIIAAHAAKKFGNRRGNLVQMSPKSRYAYADGKFCYTVMVVGDMYPCIKRSPTMTYYYGPTGVLAHEETNVSA